MGLGILEARGHEHVAGTLTTDHTLYSILSSPMLT